MFHTGSYLESVSKGVQMIQLREYQEQAVKELIEFSNSLLAREGNKTIVFKAPTGSGKTVMMAEFLKQLIENRTDDISFSLSGQPLANYISRAKGSWRVIIQTPKP